MQDPQSRPLRPGVSVVIPAYNSSRSLEPLCERLDSTLSGLGQDFEVILVNDGSRDSTWERIVALSVRYPFVRGFSLMRNFGQHNALLSGIRHARFTVSVTMDDDLQHPPEVIPSLLEALEPGCDVVYGTPITDTHGIWRNAASRLTKLTLQTVVGVEVAGQVAALRAFRTDVREAFRNFNGPFVSIDVLLTWGTTRFRAIPVRHDQRLHGETNYTFGMLLRHALNMMTGFSTLPIQLASILGFSLSAFGVVVFLLVLARYFISGSSIPGFPFLASIVAIFSGAQLFALGMIGEYVSRMHFRLMDKPPYVVREQAGTPSRE